MIETWFGMPLPLLALISVAILAGGIVRGYSGFGSSAVVVGSLAIVMSPARIVPVMYLMEIAASLSLIPSIRRHIDWSWLIPLAIANLVTTPIGVWMLTRFDERTLRLAVALSLFVLSVILLSGWSRAPSGRPVAGTVRWATGGVSGLMSGIAAIGGLSVAAMFLLTGVAAAQLRATMIALLFIMDVWALGLSYAGGIVNSQTLALCCLMAPVMMAGIGLGHRSFKNDAKRKVGEGNFRQRVSWLLFALAVAGLLRTALR